MSASKVYFTDLRTRNFESLPAKLRRLLEKSGMGTIDFTDKFVAIKIHFGELGNLAFLRPNYAKVVADFVKEKGGKPFLTDCNTLYVGSRKNALDHLETAMLNGFGPMTTGCHVIIADGLRGEDDVAIPVNGQYIKEAKIGRAVADADIVISLNHFKGHECTGFGGALKNLGMGCGSKAGKLEMHAAGKPQVEKDLCIGCGWCQKNCAHGAIVVTDRKASLDTTKCAGCGRCIGVCPKGAVHSPDDESNDVLNCKIAEYSKAVIAGKPNFHINMVMDISPCCDCHAENDAPILPDVGMFASFDPVAVDRACADACMKLDPMPNSRLTDMPHISDDHFHNSYPVTDWRSQLTHAEKIGIGTETYELIEMR